MKAVSALLSVALVGSAVAQFNGLPTCAQTCANQFLAGGIGNCGTNAKCICASSGFISDISCCLAGMCDQADQSSAVTFAQQICTANGVSVPSAVSCTSTATSANGTAVATATATGATSANAAASATAAASGSQNHGPIRTPAPVLEAIGGILALGAAVVL